MEVGVSMKTSSEIMTYLARTYFDNKCYVSHQKYKPNCKFQIHHLGYISGDLKYNQFPKTVKGKLAYMEHLKKQIEKDPTRFRLIRKMWHSIIDTFPKQAIRVNGLSRIKDDEWERLKKLVDDTREFKRKHES